MEVLVARTPLLTRLIASQAFLLFLFPLLLPLLTNDAQAMLGRRVSLSDRQETSPVTKVTRSSGNSPVSRQLIDTRSSYEVFETNTDGQIIREFVSRETSIVFCITWSGMAEPDLTEILGSYYQDADASLEAARAEPGRKPKRGVTESIVIEKSGHMRDVRGKAYAPNLVPSNVNPQDLL